MKIQPVAHHKLWVEKPWFFGHGGIDPIPVTTGRSYGAATSDAIDVDMLPQRVDMEFDDMMTSSGVPVSFHVVAQFRVVDSVKLVSQFGADRDEGKWGFWDRNMDQPLRTAVRDSVKKRDMQEMAISQSAADAVGQEVGAAANQLVQQLGLPILFTAMNVGRVNPPDAIKSQRIETAAQEQRAITEQQTKLAEDQRKPLRLPVPPQTMPTARQWGCRHNNSSNLRRSRWSGTFAGMEARIARSSWAAARCRLWMSAKDSSVFSTQVLT